MKEFKYIKWQNNCSSGACEIDRHHKKLINILRGKYFNKKIIKVIELLEKHYKKGEPDLSLPHIPPGAPLIFRNR
jgi:hemerythrin